MPANRPKKRKAQERHVARVLVPTYQFRGVETSPLKNTKGSNQERAMAKKAEGNKKENCGYTIYSMNTSSQKKDTHPSASSLLLHRERGLKKKGGGIE